MIALEKPELDDATSRKENNLASLPLLEMESLLAPYMPQVKILSSALDRTTEISSKLQKEIERLRIELKQARYEGELHLKRIEAAQRVLDRKSVRFVTWLIHFLVRRNRRRD